MTAQTLRNGDCNIAWEDLGSARSAPDEQPFLLLHGFGMSRGAMRPLASELLGQGAATRAVLADARGHGDTRAPARDDAYSYPAMRQDCITLLERCAPKGAHLVGHSMGGQVALMAAISRPDLVRSLSLIGAGPCRAVTHEKEERSWQRAAASFESATPEQLVSSLAAAAPTRDEQLSPARLYGGARGAELARVVRGGFLTVESNDEACSAVETPTLLIVGSHDEGWLEPTRRLAQLVPGAELYVAEGAGHVVHLERTADCAARIAAFIEQNSSGNP